MRLRLRPESTREQSAYEVQQIIKQHTRDRQKYNTIGYEEVGQRQNER